MGDYPPPNYSPAKGLGVDLRQVETDPYGNYMAHFVNWGGPFNSKKSKAPSRGFELGLRGCTSTPLASC